MDQDPQQEDYSLPVPEHKLLEIIEVLVYEVDFLVDDKMRENLENATSKNSLQAKLDIIKKCLNIDSIDEMIMFVEQFVVHCSIVQSEENMIDSNNPASIAAG